MHLKFILDDQNCNILWVPSGFAHGFLSLSDNTVFSYKCTDYYNKDSELGILWNDPALNIQWGIDNPIVSTKDAQLPTFSEYMTLQLGIKSS
jgi:dTDP-4-dehydrorhamnose 3,5-epimerase